MRVSVIFGLGVMFGFVIQTLHTRVDHADHTRQAKFIFLPGSITCHVPESTVALKSFELTSLEVGDTNAAEDFETAKFFRPFYPDHTLVQREGEWCFYRPESSRKKLTWQRPYRVGRWKSVTH